MSEAFRSKILEKPRRHSEGLKLPDEVVADIENAFTSSIFENETPSYKNSEAYWIDRIESARTFFGDQSADFLATLDDLATYYTDNSQLIKAEPIYRQALAIRENALGSDHPDVADTIDKLARTYMNLSQFAKAEPLFERALTIKKKAFGPDHKNVAAYVIELAAHNYNQQDHSKATKLFLQALGILEKQFFPRPANWGAVTSQGREAHAQGRHDDAEGYWLSALDIAETLDDQGERVAATLSLLADLYTDQGRYAEAEPFYERSLEIWEKILAPEHPNAELILIKLARVYIARHQYEKASELYIRALAIRKTSSVPSIRMSFSPSRH